jgi:PAS domain S-box-containing protein
MEPLKVVIIDDEEAHFHLMKRAIEKAFPLASVYYFEEADACLESLDEITPDVIITDYLMPGINGIKFLEALNQGKKDIPVIMITGQGNENIAVQAMKLGAWDYLVKTTDFFTLIPSVIQKVVHKRKLKESLRKSERRFRDLAESTSDWIWEVDLEARYVYSNPVVESLLGYRPDQMLGKYFYDFFSEKERDALALSCLETMVKGKPISSLDARCVHKDGHEIILEISGVPFSDNAGNLLGYRGINRDITTRMRCEEHIRNLSQQLIKAQESERQRLSRDLHDNLAQDLSTLKISLDTLFDDQPDTPSEKRQRVSEVSKMIQRAIMDIRDLAYDLRPASLDQLGLVETVLHYCQDFSEPNALKVDFFSIGLDNIRLDSDTEITLYRLIQEGLNNIRKHADASHVTVRLSASFPHIILRIEDNGKGFDLEKRSDAAFQEKRMGLRTMAERAALLNGKLKIESRSGQGTKIVVEVPYKE